MKSKYFLGLAITLLLSATSSSFAQGAATQAKPQALAGNPTNVNVPTGKVAVIFSAAFQDPKQGIARFAVLLNKLNGEFQKAQDDLTQMGKNIQALQDEITKMQQNPGDGKILQSKV